VKGCGNRTLDNNGFRFPPESLKAAGHATLAAFIFSFFCMTLFAWRVDVMQLWMRVSLGRFDNDGSVVFSIDNGSDRRRRVLGIFLGL
jgi:hypothetical protein